MHFELGPRAFAQWDAGVHDWETPPGEREIGVGASSRDVRVRGTLRLAAADD